MTTPPREARIGIDARWQSGAWTHVLGRTWQQVSQHLDISACCDQLWPVWVAHLPMERMWVRRLVAGQAAWETVAVVPWDAPLASVPSRTPARPDEVVMVDSEYGFFRVPKGASWWPGQGPVQPWAATLRDGDTVVGVLVVEAGDGLFGHLELLYTLLAPLVVALRNDSRIQELARLREAVEADNRALLSRLARDAISGTVVGAESGLRDVWSRLGRVSQTDAPVLILGETGTGKELVAREVHGRSNRARGPFLKVNCGAIPADLVDSELFGHEKGSFTGAVGERRGWFERASGGTLFLDEVAELPLAAQVRLLRVLQDGAFERVGGQRPRTADVRIIAATHRDLREMVSQGRFREDLWHRIGVFPIRLPPLRARLADLPALAAHFAAQAGIRLFGRALAVGADDVRLLSAYSWPGNVRELGAVMERAAILGDGQHLDVRGALGVQVDAAPPSHRISSVVHADWPSPPIGTWSEVTRSVLEEALRQSAGKIEGKGGAATRLGVKPSTLRSRLEKLDIDWRRFRPGAEDHE